MHFLYIIFSKSLNKHYVGESHYVDERLVKHNKHIYKRALSNITDNWCIVISKSCQSKKDALFLEASN
ncbi:MAG: GIY-YIG nuclease family protein [Flavobacteriaceae bacterium]